MYVTEQAADGPGVGAESMQEPLKVPVLFVASANVPVGVIAVPALEVSVTWTMQVDGLFTVTEPQVMLVELVRRLTMMLKAVAVELPL